MRKRIIAIILCALMTASVFAGGNSETADSKGKTTITVMGGAHLVSVAEIVLQDYMEQHPDIPLAMSWADYVDESGNVIKRLQRIKPEKDNFFEDLLFSKNVVFCPGIYIMRTDIFFKYVPSRHINESRIGQNYQILLPVAYHEKRIGYIDKTLYKYILHKNSHSNKDNNNYEKTIRRFQEHENTLYDLVKNICDVNDQNIYTRKVFVHFNRFYLRLANEYGMKSEVKVYYNKLKVVGENGIKQKIYYIMGMLGIKAR